MMLETLPAHGWRLFKIHGQLDLASAPTVRAALRHVAALDHGSLLIDLEDVQTADEIGVETLVSTVQRLEAERAGTTVAFIAHNRLLVDMLAAAGQSAAVYSDGSRALRSLGLAPAA